ncbi:MAG TPA: MarR family transcriptional regulator [Candidatus Cybelea sp.]|nr:MarR family transcriptional regulator [Candidatus Cybelea sp.]
MPRRRKPSPPVPPLAPVDAPSRRRLPILLRHAWFSLNQTFRRRLAHTGVTPDQFTALRTLMEHEPQGLTQSGLNRLIASDPNTIAALVERMEGAGWITRVRHEQDRRANRLRLLPAGRETYERVRQIAIALQTEILGGWSERKREGFLEDLADVAERCRKAASGEGKAAPK